MSFWKKIVWLVKDPSPKAQRLRQIIEIGFIIVLFVILFWMIPIQQVIQAILTAKPAGVLISFLLALLGLVLTAVEMEPLIRSLGIRRSIYEILEINLAVKFYIQFTPTPLISTGLRWYRLAQPGNKPAEAFAALFFYRLLETFLTFTLGLGFWFASGHQNSTVSALWMAGLVVAIILFWITLTRFSVPLYQLVKSHSYGLLERPLVQPLSRKVEKLLATLSAYADIPARDLFLAIAAGVASLFARLAASTTLAQAVGIDIGFMQMGWIQAIVMTATTLPFAVAGGVGIRDVTLVALLASYNISPELSLAYSFLVSIQNLLISLLGGITEAIRAFRHHKVPAGTAPASEPPQPTTKES